MPFSAPLPELASLAGLNGALRSGRLKARALVRATAEPLKEEARPGGAVREVLEDEAMRAAHDVERELGRGRTRGLLQGAPFGVSELLAVAGRRPAWDAGAADARGAGDSAPVARLRGVKALPLAVTASPPLGGVTDGFLASETAAASVVARGLLPFALAVDFNGNVIRAALAQGCCALRPTFGAVSGYGVAPLGWTLATAAVLARSAEDCGVVVDRISGSDSRSPHSPGRAFHFAPQYARAPAQLRAALVQNDEALKASLARLGVGMAEFSGPGLPAVAVLDVILASEAGEAFASELESAPGGREYLAEAAGLRAFDYLRAMRLRRQIQAWLAEAAGRADILVAPWGPARDAQDWLAAEAASACPACTVLAAAILAGAPLFASPAAGGSAWFAVARPQAENTLLRFASAMEAASGGGGAAAVQQF